jgi:hypothetical protein
MPSWSAPVEILNRYRGFLQNSDRSTHMVGHDNWQYVRQCVRDALVRHEQEFQCAIRGARNEPDSSPSNKAPQQIRRILAAVTGRR